MVPKMFIDNEFNSTMFKPLNMQVTSDDFLNRAKIKLGGQQSEILEGLWKLFVKK